MILLALVSTFIALHNLAIPDNPVVSGVVTIVIVMGFFVFDEKMDLEDRIKGKGKYKDDYKY